MLVATAVPLGLAPAALATEDGQIVGTVTDASTQAAVAGMMVCMWPYAGSYRGVEYLVASECVESGSNGEYALSRVPAGTYGVIFFVPVQNMRTLDYALQFYGGGSQRSEGREVVVRSGETTSEVNAAMGLGGKVKGVVTDALTQAPIAGVEACTSALGEPGPALMVRCGVTNSSGEYTIPALSTGEYVVEFHVTPEGPLDYARQFYDGHTTATGATKVPVTTGETTTGIDVAMQPGGNIAGRVTAAATGAALKAIEVCAVSIADGTKQGCRGTNASGEYFLSQLPAGEYAIEFGGTLGYGANRGYGREYYGGKASLSEASPLSVAPGVTLSGIDASLHAIGEESIKPPPAPEAALSASLAVATPLVGKTPIVTLMGSMLVISGNTASVHVVCSKAACQGSIELVAQVASKRHKGKAAATRKKTLVLATGSFSLAAGRDGSVSLRLTAAGRKKLAHARRHPIVAKLAMSVKGGRTMTESVLVS